MKNYETPNMEFSHQHSIPEDRALIFRANGETITKAWDASGHSFQIPSARDLGMAGYFPAYRTGEYNSGGNEGFELHTENAALTSWWTPSTGTTSFVKIVSSAMRLAAPVNIQTGAITGFAKSYIVVGNGSFHGEPETIEGDIHFAVDFGPRWGIVITGYGVCAVTLNDLFTYKDVDMRLSMDIDPVGNLLDVRITYAGIWFGVRKLWYPSITENPIQTNKYWYYPHLIGVNVTRAVFLYLARSEEYNAWEHMGLQEFDYTTKKWKVLSTPVIDGDPSIPTSVQVQFTNYPFMMTLTPNNRLYMVWMQYQTYISGTWKNDWDIVVRKMSSTGWEAATTLASGTDTGLSPSLKFCGGSFNNNDYGFAYYVDNTLCLKAALYSAGAWGAGVTVSSTANTARPVLFAQTEANNNRHYLFYYDAAAVAFYGAIEVGAGWVTTRIDTGGGLYYWPQVTLVDDAQKLLVSWHQVNTNPTFTSWYSRFYDSTGWGATTIHESYSGQLFGVAQLGQAYNGNRAVIAMLGVDFQLGTGVLNSGLWVDIYDGSTWGGVTLIESLSNYVFPNESYDHDLELPCFIDSSHNIYIAYCKIDAATPSNNFVKIAYYNYLASTWTMTKLNTTPNKNVYMCGSWDHVLIAWEESQQVFACIGEDGDFSTPKRISYYNPAMDYCGTNGVVPDTNYIPPMLAMYGGQYLAMMCYSRNRNFPPDAYDYYYGEKEAVIANTGIFTT